MQLLQQHVEEELSVLNVSNDNCMAPALADSTKQLSRLADRPAPVKKWHRQRSTTSKQHPAGQQKVSPALCGEVFFLSALQPGICHPSALCDVAMQ